MKHIINRVTEERIRCTTLTFPKSVTNAIETKIETPACLLYTKAGKIGNIRFSYDSITLQYKFIFASIIFCARTYVRRPDERCLLEVLSVIPKK